MKNINSPARTIGLIGLSIFVHGAAFWATTENITLKRLSEAAQVLREAPHHDENSDITHLPVQNLDAEKIQPQQAPVATETAPAEASQAVETQTLKSTEKAQRFAFKKVESFQPRIQKVKEEEIAKVLPKKEVVQEEQESALPAKTVAVVEDLSPEIKDEEPQSLTEKIRSYLGLRQVEGNQPPTYPMEARKQGLSGRVILNYFVTETGGVKDITVTQSSGHKVLDDEAVRAISGFRFYPGQEGWTEHSVKFNLSNGSAPKESRSEIPADLGASNNSKQSL